MNKEDIEIRTTNFRLGLRIKHIPSGIEIGVPDQGSYEVTKRIGLERLSFEIDLNNELKH